jgi:hypothetical protein
MKNFGEWGLGSSVWVFLSDAVMDGDDIFLGIKEIIISNLSR